MTAGFGSGITGVAVLIWLLTNVLCYAANENSWLSKLLHVPPLLCVSNGLKFSEPQPETFWVFDLLDPRDLARSFWIGSRGLLLLRLLITVYLAQTLTTNGLSADGWANAHWLACFTTWSLCLVFASATLGVAVSLKYLVIHHQVTRTVVHGRPGLAPSYRESAYTVGSSATTVDVEVGTTSNSLQPAVPAGVRGPHTYPLEDTSWVMQAPVLIDRTAISRDGIGPRTSVHAVHSQLAGASVTSPKSESAFAKSSRHTRTPSDLESMAPAELRYAPELMHWSILEKVHCLVLQTAAVTSTLVLVFYWAVIAGSDTTSLFPDDYLKHAAIAPIMLLDVWFSKVPFASYHLQVMILYGCVYELFMWVYYGASDHWVYNTLDWYTDKSAVVYILLPLGYVVLFFVWFAVASLRNCMGFQCGSHLLCPRCYERHSHHAASQPQKQKPLATGRLKKQSSNVIPLPADGNDVTTCSLNIIAADTRYSGQQVLTTGRQTSTQSPENPSLMELSRRASAPRQS